MHALIDVTRSDGTITAGANISFAFDTFGTQESVDDQGNTVIEYEKGDALANQDLGFVLGDQSQFIPYVESIGMGDRVSAIMEIAVQEGRDVLFIQGNQTLATVQNTSISDLWELVNTYQVASQDLGLDGPLIAYDGDMW